MQSFLPPLKVNMKSVDSTSIFNFDYRDGDLAIISELKELPKLSSLKSELNIMLICMNGWAKMEVNGDLVELQKNKICFFLPGAYIDNLSQSNDCTLKILLLSDELIHTALHSNYDMWNKALYVRRIRELVITDDSMEWFKTYCDIIHKRLNSHSPHNKQVIQALLQAVLLDFCDILLTSDTEESNFFSINKVLFQRFLDLISVTQPKRQTVAFYARKLCVTSKYLSFVCKTISNQTASDWIRNYVNEELRYMLKRPDLTSKQVATRMGFSNLSFFGKYVKDNLGCSPREYRKSFSRKMGNEVM